MDTPTPELILIVDDTPANLDVISDALSDAGFEVAIATSGERALQQVEYERPTLILLDIMMPGIDGFETCKRLKANPKTRDIPIIFMTALSDIDRKLRALELGAVDYVTKPFQEQEVIARVRTHVTLAAATGELEKKNKDLEQTLKQLQETQIQLIQTEKMSSLGQLVAGVAHEFNNPVNFIQGNIDYADNYTEDLMRLIALYQRHYPQPHPDISQEIEKIDLEFLKDDFNKVFQSMRSGVVRISEIIKSLRIFSCLDEAELKKVNLHEGIESILTILQNRLRSQDGRQSIQVIKDYGNLPLVECYAGQLHQVFMNILGNAIDALEQGTLTNDRAALKSEPASDCKSALGMASKPRQQRRTAEMPEIVPASRPCDYIVRGNLGMPRTHLQPSKTHCPEESQSPVTSHQSPEIQPQICIRTRSDGKNVTIAIADNGIGMSEETRAKLFDPFFTTKPIGKGTGLGLSISYQIVTEKHHGTLTCTAQPGETLFTIEIPIHQDRY